MTAFAIRTRGYQAGVLLLSLTTALFVIGLVSPMWLVWNREIPEIRKEHFYAGVLVGCKYNLRLVGATSFDYTRCGFGFGYAFETMKSMGGWVHAVETFEILSAVALIFACIYAALFNCFTDNPGKRTRILEITSGLAGLVSFIFSMVFVGQLREEVEYNVFYYFSWSFYLTVVASIGAMLSAVIIALFNEYIPAADDYNYSNAAAVTKAQPQGVAYTSQGPQNVEFYDPRIAQSNNYDEERARYPLGRPQAPHHQYGGGMNRSYESDF